MAMMAAPKTPATPMLAMLAEAAPVEELPLAPVAVELLPELPEGEDAGVVAVVVAALEVAAALVAGVVAGVVPAELDELPEAELPPLFMQLVEVPGWIVTAADWANAPVESLRSRPMLVPAAMSVGHVNEVVLNSPRFSIAAALG